MYIQVQPDRPFSINSPNHPQRLAPWLARPLEDLFALSRLNTLYQHVRQTTTPQTFLDAALDLLNMRVQMQPADRAQIPTSGPTVVVVNHPFGLAEGMLLAQELLRVRSDVKVMANYLLEQVPQLRDLFIFVDPFATNHSVQANLSGLKEALQWLEQGKLLVIFPAGEVAHIDLRSRQVIDPPWSTHVARLVRRSGASVLPAYFCGRNGVLFHIAGLVHPRLRTALLPREFLKKCNQTVELRLGSMITAQQLVTFATDPQLTHYLRLRTYALSSRHSSAQPVHPGLHLPRRFTKAPTLAAVCASVAPGQMQAELAQLPSEQLLVESGDFCVYLAGAQQIPNGLTEIGRLRELTFRACGEGTGQGLDLDAYDLYYRHLLLWNRATCELVGAYRIGLADQIVSEFGAERLYTSSLFRFDPAFLPHLRQALELGRSFIRVEYQRGFAPLFLLWRGIGQFLIRNPRYKVLFGPVSMSNAYAPASRQLLIAFLQQHYSYSELAHLVKPRNPPRQLPIRSWQPQQLAPLLSEIDDLSDVIQDIEATSRGVPILFKQYLKLGARVLAFHVDSHFNHTLDVLVMADLTRSDPKILGRYIEKTDLDRYLAYHQIGE